MTQVQRTKRERLDSREKLILDSAESVILKKGPEGFTMGELARNVDLAEGTLYLYFKNKKSIIHAVVARHWERSIEAARDVVKPVEGCFEKMEVLARFHVNLMIQNEALVDSTIYDRKPGLPERISDLENKRNYTAVFDEIFKMGVATKDIDESVELWMVRDLFFGLLTYMSRSISLHPDPGKVDDAVEFAMNAVEGSCRGIRPNGGEQSADKLAGLITKMESVVAELKTVEKKKNSSRKKVNRKA